MFRVVLTFFLFSTIFPLNTIINSGPMVGYSEKSEVALWIQTKESSKVKFIYWDIDNSAEIFETKEIITDKKSGSFSKILE